MSVLKKNQSEHRFTTLDLILDMYDHTSTLIANEKVFDRTYKELIDRIDNEAAMTYHCCRVANFEYDNRIKEEAETRLALQKEAIDHCLWLKTDIFLAQRKFHLRAKKVTYWSGLVDAALKSIKAWHSTEAKEYKKNFGL